MSGPSSAFAWRYDLQILKTRPRNFHMRKQRPLVEDSRKRPLITCRSDVAVITSKTKPQISTARNEPRQTDASRYSRPDIPECLDTFSDFYNPATPANERFEKYLQEMDRRKQEALKVKAMQGKPLALGPTTENEKPKQASSYTVLPKIELTAPSATDVARVLW